MNQITDDLWITDIRGVRRLSVPTDTVVTVCQDSVADNIGCRYHYFNMSDGEPDEYGGDDSYTLFETAVDTVRYELQDGNAVVVHCHVGRSRSAAVCTAVLAARHGIRCSEALTRVQDARPIADPGPSLLEHVRRYCNEPADGIDSTDSWDDS